MYIICRVLGDLVMIARCEIFYLCENADSVMAIKRGSEAGTRPRSFRS